MAAKTRERKQQIITILRKRGPSGPTAVAKALGTEWTTPNGYNALRQQLLSMWRAHLLVRSRHGTYEVSPSVGWRGLDAGDEVEKAIGAFLRDRGGIARTADIHEAITDRRLNGSERNYDHRRVTLLLKNSDRFHQDFGRGYWNLPLDQLEHLPLLGMWADYLIQARWDEQGESGSFETWEDMREDFFVRVGQAFRDARGDRPLSHVADQWDTSSALAEMALAAPNARQLAVEALRIQVAGELADEGVSNLALVAGEVVRRMDADLGGYLYAEFERGNAELHLVAPVEFYRACALRFGVCPARLSRGEVVPSQVHSSDT